MANPAYDKMIADAATELERRLRRGEQDLGIWAMPTTSERNGRIIVATRAPEPESGTWPVYIRPNHNRASTFVSWRSVPYSGLYHILWHALRCEPILPIHSAAA